MKNFIRIISFMIVAVLILSSVLPVSIYASSLPTGGDNSGSTGVRNGPEDIIMQVTAYETLRKSTNETITIPVVIDAYNSSYIKEASITFENSNFNVVKSELETDKNIQSIKDDVIKLNSSEIDESITLNIPVSFKKLEYIPEEYFTRYVTIKLEGTYVNNNGEEKSFSKEGSAHISWFINSKEVVLNTEVVRSFTFTENDQRNYLVTFKIESGIKNGAAPEDTKSFELNTPKLANIDPEVTISSENHIINATTVDEKTIFIKDPDKNERNEYKWDNENDIFYATYIYRNIPNNPFITQRAVLVKTRVATLDNPANEIEKNSESISIPLATEIKNTIVATTTATPSINRGAILSAATTEATFDVKYTLNIGYTAMTNQITINELLNQCSEAYKTKSISVDRDDLISILGEEGKITVTIKNGVDRYEINKDNTTLSIPSNTDIGSIYISAPTGVGNLNISLVKSIKPEAKDVLSGRESIDGGIMVLNTDSVYSTDTYGSEWQTMIEEPTQKVNIESKFKTLSTIKKNERMVLSVILESDSVDDYLYKNPSLRISYPEVVKTISNVTTNILYNDYNEFNNNVEVNIDNANHMLVLSLTGTQTKYVASAVSKGILIQITADYTLDRLAPTKDSNMVIEVYNENTRAITNLEKGFRVVAPTEFIMQNKMDVTSPTNSNGTSDKYYFKDSRVTIEEDVEDIILPLYSNAKYIDVYGTVVNNQGVDVENATIIGSFPSSGSNGTFNTTIIGGVVVDKENKRTEADPNGTYSVYYSKNENESINSSNWSATLQEDAKSYKIVFYNAFADTARKDFHYRVKTPEDMTYNEHAQESFALAYANGAVSGEQYSYVRSKPIRVATKTEADFSVNITVKDFTTKEAIQNGGNVKEGAYLEVEAAITNVSNRNIRNVKAAIELLQNLRKVDILEDKVLHYSGDDIEESINEIKASETKIIKKTIFVSAVGAIQRVEEANENGIPTYRTVDDDSSGQEFYSIMDVKIYEGNEVGFKTQEFKNRIETRNIFGITVSPADKQDVGITDTFKQYFYIRNLSVTDKENIEIKGKLPEGIDYDTEKNSKIKEKGLTYSYDTNSREYTIKIDKIEGDGIAAGIEVNLKTANYGTYELKTRVRHENNEINLNSINVVVAGKARNFEVSHTISTPTNVVKDTDIFDFNIIIKNHWDIEKTVEFRDRLNSEFEVREYSIVQNNKVIAHHKNVNLIDYDFNMQPEDIVEIRIKCGLRTQSKDATINLTHSPEAKSKNVNIFINPITISVIGTGNFVNTNDPIINGKYTVSGTAWLDANNDGRRETTEQRISNITLKLIDNSTNKVFVDDSGREKTTTTNNNGDYLFTDIPVGSYVVIAYYDYENYGCGDYQTRDVSHDLNNDFIETEFEGRVVGATNNIIIQNGSIYAVDISLIPRNTFDMELEKNVTNISVATSTGKEANYNFNSSLAKIEISNEKGVNYYLVIEYTLVIKNVGYIDGYAKSVVDYIPKGMTFVQEDNPGWYIKADGHAYNNTLSNTLIKAQQQTELKIKLRKEITAEQTGIVKNSAEINETYNVEGVEDINSKAANKDSSENDYSEALIVVALSTGGQQAIRIAGIVFGVFAFGIVIITFTKYKRKKKII